MSTSSNKPGAIDIEASIVTALADPNLLVLIPHTERKVALPSHLSASSIVLQINHLLSLAYNDILADNNQAFLAFLNIVDLTKLYLSNYTANSSANADTDISIYNKTTLFSIWEIRLSSLILSNNFANNHLKFAREESKRLSILLNDKNSLFLLPLNLSILILRLNHSFDFIKSLYDIIWQLRFTLSNNLDNQNLSLIDHLKIHIISYNIAADLILKRDYLTFISFSNSILNYSNFKSLDNKHNNDENLTNYELKLSSNFALLSTLISFIHGDYDNAEYYFNKLLSINSLQSSSSSQNNSNLDSNYSILSLKKILLKYNPILDNDIIKPLKSPPTISSIDNLLELHKKTRITGRILCCFCALAELDLRTFNNHIDILKNDQSSTHPLLTPDSDQLKSLDYSQFLTAFWKQNLNKLYTFE
ncbi:uncharacterized protein ASCRUDRAFT_78830 [Ascoidea rubescens DSM 1968]|uniref:Uncharacterized protein n=1 Tax=Ascoidea rubescens DSM 1968 TaxID=1344418 RepID=A0A1D2VQD6_9ASCO|nr:hypothetical protein ASCRUDRAFT_78830 [Ascoidea rubescens DSM 1968]ODV63819.1 hypothetical protein ASCRUDRAFT_78830 [Ascoidea rubescens DSM 1968]